MMWTVKIRFTFSRPFAYDDNKILLQLLYSYIEIYPVTHKGSHCVNYISTITWPYHENFVWTFRSMTRLYVGELLVAHPTPKLEDHPLLSLRDCLFNTFVATLHIRGRSSIRNLKTRHAVVQSADKVLARPGKKEANVSVRMARISFGALPCRKKKNLMTARVSMLLKLRASVTCLRACFLLGRAKDLSAPR